MPTFAELTADDLQAVRAELGSRYESLKAIPRMLDMTRGKPCAEQLDLSVGLLDCLGPHEYLAADGTDCRNYGGLEGLPEIRALFGEVLGVPAEQLIVCGNSSLALMHAVVAHALLLGVPGGAGPWAQQAPRFLCPSPGYDRHFAVCEHLGIEMTAVDILADGPDMDAVERLAGGDERVKGIWCVPKYSNPTGVVFADEVVDRLAAMETAAPDFRIMWDNAYALHDLTDEPRALKDMLQACAQAGSADRVLMFASTSKITFAGAGVAMMAASPANVEWFRLNLSKLTIGPDKLNQLRHVRFLRDAANVRAHMRRHAAILRPKFQAVLDAFDRELADTGVAEWSRPEGGYFVSVNVMDGCAKRVVALAADLGVKLTGAGATFPYGDDPRDRNIRVAPSLPPLDDVREAMKVVAVCVQLAAAEKLAAD